MNHVLQVCRPCRAASPQSLLIALRALADGNRGAALAALLRLREQIAAGQLPVVVEVGSIPGNRVHGDLFALPEA